MLRSLHIENVAVIKCADIDFENGFTVLTGETGAGKSIIIDSINMLMGNKTSRSLIRNGEDHALVSAVFEDISDHSKTEIEELGFECTDGTVFVQRSITSDGKSTAKLNGRTVTQSILREVGRLLINIHGQSDNQRLMQKESHIELLDAFADNGDDLEVYKNAFAVLQELKSKKRQLEHNESERLRMQEMLEYQIKDIDSAKLVDGEEERLLAERVKIQNLERITKQGNFAYKVLHGNDSGVSVTSLIDRAVLALQQISDVTDGLPEMSEKLTAMRYDIEDIAETVLDAIDSDCDDPTARLDEIETRLDIISKLQRKYGATVADVLEFCSQAKTRLDEIVNSESVKEELDEKIETELLNIKGLAEVLTKERKTAARQISESVAQSLVFLDMPKVRFDVSVKSCEDFGADGADDVEFLIATNPGEPLLPMIKIASGGELSRIMLSLKSVLNNRDGVDTVIFDEVDTGISGKTSQKVGIKLRQISKEVQTVCITHSPQIASLADNHYNIVKEENEGRSETSVRYLDQSERIEEIARILGGINITDKQRETAAELLCERKNY